MSEVANNCYRLLEYLDDNHSDSGQNLDETYQKQLIIQDDLAIHLKQSYSWFEGFICTRGGKIHAIFAAVQMKVSSSSFDQSKKKFMGTQKFRYSD